MKTFHFSFVLAAFIACNNTSTHDIIPPVSKKTDSISPVDAASVLLNRDKSFFFIPDSSEMIAPWANIDSVQIYFLGSRTTELSGDGKIRIAPVSDINKNCIGTWNYNEGRLSINENGKQINYLVVFQGSKQWHSLVLINEQKATYQTFVNMNETAEMGIIEECGTKD